MLTSVNSKQRQALLQKFFLVLSISSVGVSLSYDVPHDREATFYALDGNSLRLEYHLPPSESRNASIFSWNITLANGTNFDLDAAEQSSNVYFSVTSERKATTLTIKSFAASFMCNSTYTVRAMFDTSPYWRTSVQVTLIQGQASRYFTESSLPIKPTKETKASKKTVGAIVGAVFGAFGIVSCCIYRCACRDPKNSTSNQFICCCSAYNSSREQNSSSQNISSNEKNSCSEKREPERQTFTGSTYDSDDSDELETDPILPRDNIHQYYIGYEFSSECVHEQNYG